MKMKKNYMIILSALLAVGSLQAQRSPYISKVHDYKPAPGQFINTAASGYEDGYTQDEVLASVSEVLVGETNMGLVSLGSFGGYLVVGFDHPIINLTGEYDFKVYGNATYASIPTETGKPGGSSEPGIVMVSADANGNGLPDDPWYELAGSEYDNPATTKDYEITYYRPTQPKQDVRWTDNAGAEGTVPRVTFHQQDHYYPQWIEEGQITFRGTRLPKNAVDEGKNGVQNWVLYAYDWGYADNHPNKTELCKFKIDWAVDQQGQPIYLPQVDFVKIYTGMLQVAGWTGETSTEVSGVEDLHPDAMANGCAVNELTNVSVINPVEHMLYIRTEVAGQARLYNTTGHLLGNYPLQDGINNIPVSHISAGIYLLRVQSGDKVSDHKLVKH